MRTKYYLTDGVRGAKCSFGWVWIMIICSSTVQTRPNFQNLCLRPAPIFRRSFKGFKRFLRVLGALLVPLDVFKDHTNPLQGTFLRGKDIWLRGVQNVPPRIYFSKTQPKNTPAIKKTFPRGVYLPPPRETRIFKEGEIPSLSHRPNPIVRSMRYRL